MLHYLTNEADGNFVLVGQLNATSRFVIFVWNENSRIEIGFRGSHNTIICNRLSWEFWDGQLVRFGTGGEGVRNGVVIVQIIYTHTKT